MICQHLKLNAEDLLDSRVNYLSKYVAREKCYLGIWTSTDALLRSEFKAEMAERKLALRHLPALPRDKQDIAKGLKSLRERHVAMCDSIKTGLRAAELLVEDITAADMLRVARASNCPEWTPDSWTPALPGAAMPKVDKPGSSPLRTRLDDSDLFYPSLASQIMPRDAYRGLKTVQIGDHIYAPVAMEIPPRQIMPFATLLSKLKEGGIPFRITFRIQGGGLTYARGRKAFAAMLAWAKGYNAKIKDTLEALEEEADQESVCRYSISLCTWAHIDEVSPDENRTGSTALLTSRRNRLIQYFQSWGDIELRETTGDPLEMFTDCMPFTKRQSVGNYGLAPLSHILSMLPVTRPASPWESGSVLYRSIDGKLLPFETGSSLQSTWAYIFVAMPGSGKSVALANILLGSSMEGGLTRMPRVAILDIGPSSSGLINMLKDLLPPDQQHYVSHFRMYMDRKYCINILDTQVTCRYPTPEHKQTLVNFITQLATPAERSAPYDSMSQLVGKVVDQMYAMCADTTQGNPKPYGRHVSREVDECLDKLGFEPNENTCWWEVVDYLFNHGHVHEATLAQRYAVPLIPDAIPAVKEPAVKDVYNIRIQDTGEMLYDAFARLITDATRDYCVLAEPTRFDIGDVRIAAIDIEPVAKPGEGAAKKQTALMYMLAKYALTKDYRLLPDSIQYVAPEHSRNYHIQRCKQIHSDMKWVVLDEYHRTKGSASAREEISVEIREGRKWRTGIILASQTADDFPDDQVSQVTGRFILKAGDPITATAMQQKFGFNDTAKEMLVKYCNGPTKDGAPFLAQLNTTKGTITQLMYLTLAPIEAWAMTTTAVDVALREALTEKLGREEARARLARAYPQSAVQEIELLKRTHASTLEATDPNAKPFNPMELIMEKLLQAPPVYGEARIGSVTNGQSERLSDIPPPTYD